MIFFHNVSLASSVWAASNISLIVMFIYVLISYMLESYFRSESSAQAFMIT